jgi:hypothetical protein
MLFSPMFMALIPIFSNGEAIIQVLGVHSPVLSTPSPCSLEVLPIFQPFCWLMLVKAQLYWLSLHEFLHPFNKKQRIDVFFLLGISTFHWDHALWGVFFWGDGILVGFKAHPRRALSLPVRGGCQQAAGLPKMGLPQ